MTHYVEDEARLVFRTEEEVKSIFQAMDTFDSSYSTGGNHDRDYTFFVWCACRDAVNDLEIMDPVMDFNRQVLSQVKHFGCLDAFL